MKKLVLTVPSTEISVEELFRIGQLDHKIYAYKSCGTKNGYCVLVKLYQEHYGFVPLNSCTSSPRFIASTIEASLQVAVKSRKVFCFDDMSELITNMAIKAF